MSFPQDDFKRNTEAEPIAKFAKEKESAKKI
jgi:hypothetical protein